MSSLKGFSKPAPLRYSLPVPQEDKVLAWQKDVCVRFGVPWPPPKAKAGKPNRQALWLRVIYAEVRAGRTFPDGLTAAVPCAWLPGDSVASACLTDVEVAVAGEMAQCEAVDDADPIEKRKRNNARSCCQGLVP